MAVGDRGGQRHARPGGTRGVLGGGAYAAGGSPATGRGSRRAVVGGRVAQGDGGSQCGRGRTPPSSTEGATARVAASGRREQGPALDRAGGGARRHYVADSWRKDVQGRGRGHDRRLRPSWPASGHGVPGADA